MKPDEIIKIIEYIKEQTDFKGDIFININKNAIPIEWIEKQIEQYYDDGYNSYGKALNIMLADWKAENGRNK